MHGNDTSGAVDTLRGMMRDLNHAWLDGNVNDIRKYYAEDAVMVLPGFTDRVVGRSPCVDSYREFVENAAVQNFEELDSMIDVWDSTAVVSYEYRIAYRMAETDYEETSRELVVFAQRNGGWQIVWRTVLSTPV